MGPQTSGGFTVSTWVGPLEPSQSFCPHAVLENDIREKCWVNIGSTRKECFDFVISSHLILIFHFPLMLYKYEFSTLHFGYW